MEIWRSLMEIQRTLQKRKRHGRIDKKMAAKMSISGRIFHQIAVRTFFGFHVNLEHAFHQIAPNSECVRSRLRKRFSIIVHSSGLLASNIDQTGKIFSYYASTYKNHNGHNYLLLHYRSILPLSIACLVLFCGKITQ